MADLDVGGHIGPWPEVATLGCPELAIVVNTTVEKKRNKYL
jgi:hypothetical protein